MKVNMNDVSTISSPVPYNWLGSPCFVSCPGFSVGCGEVDIMSNKGDRHVAISDSMAREMRCWVSLGCHNHLRNWSGVAAV